MERSLNAASQQLAASLDGPAIRLTCAWVGDSRAMAIFPDGSVRALSIDHRIDDVNPGGERERVMLSHNQEAAAPSGLGGKRRTVVARRQCKTTGQMGPEVIFNEETGGSGRALPFLGLEDDSRYLCFAPSHPLQACLSWSHEPWEMSWPLRPVFRSQVYTTSLFPGAPGPTTSLVPHRASSISLDSPIRCPACPVLLTFVLRIILASDGVWDVFNNQTVASMVRKIKDARKAAKGLVTKAKSQRTYRGMSTDDISALIIDT